MPIAIPSYIPDLDDWTARRLERLVIRRRRIAALLRAGLSVAALSIAVLAFGARETVAAVGNLPNPPAPTAAE